MTTVAEAEARIREHLPEAPTEVVPLPRAVGRILREPVRSERDLPPFDRVTMDGIAIASRSFQDGRRQFRIAAVQAAGAPAESCPEPDCCVRVMTGAVRPDNTDAVIPFERLRIDGDLAIVEDDAIAEPGRYIHPRASDRSRNDIVLEPGVRIGPAESAVLASAGQARVTVSRLPRVAVISTGDELVAVDATGIAPWQIRSSNDIAIAAGIGLAGLGECTRTTLPDVPEAILASVGELHETSDVLILSGGVSMGDFDFVPAVLERLDARVVFHRIAQKPGKPMWFGVSGAGKPIFALPGNPVSTLLCMTRYVLPALRRSAGLTVPAAELASLKRDIEGPADLSYFVPVVLQWSDSGVEIADPRPTNTSGDFSSLAATDGFIELPPGQGLRRAGAIGRIFRW